MAKLHKLQQWLLYTTPGRYVLRSERLFYHNNVQNIFGFYSLQIGLPNINLLQGNKITNHYTLEHNVLCDLNLLPFANNSIDLIICPHVLEYQPNYQYFIAECYRILIPNGKLIITSFNKKSLFHLFASKHEVLEEANMLSLEQVKQTLEEANFTISGGKFFSYAPPLNNSKTLTKLSWLEKAGDRWLPTFANTFGLIAVKEIITSDLVGQIPNNYNEKLTPNLGNAKICNQ